MHSEELHKEDRGAWDSFVAQNSFPPAFTQTSAWPGNFFVVGARDEQGELMAGARGEIRDLWLGKRMGWMRRITQNRELRTQNEGTQSLIHFIVQKARKEKIIFLRIQSGERISVSAYQLIQPRFLTHLQDPAHTLLVNLTYSEAELFAGMHPKTRYNIRLADKKGVEVREGTIDEFSVLYEQTNQRKGIKGYSKEYFQHMLSSCHSPDTLCRGESRKEKQKDPNGRTVGMNVKMFIAEYQQTPVAASFCLGYGNTLAYLFGGTSDTYRDLMAPHLLHWNTIQYAKNRGYQWYDFGGVNPLSPSGQEGIQGGWSGITRFKSGFVSKETGKEIFLGETKDLVIDRKWYRSFSLMKRVKEKVF